MFQAIFEYFRPPEEKYIVRYEVQERGVVRVIHYDCKTMKTYPTLIRVAPSKDSLETRIEKK